MARMPDVTVIGGGIFGLSCAWELTRRGAGVRVIEAHDIGAGASGGNVGALAPHSPENWNGKKAFQLESLLMAPQFWGQVDAVSGLCAGYSRSGRLQPIADPASAARMAERVEAAAIRWPKSLGMRLTRNVDTALKCDCESGIWLEDHLTARIAPRAALTSLAAAVQAKGGVIETQRTVHADEISGLALWATGVAGLAALSDDLGRDMGKGVKGQSALLEFHAPDAPQIFADAVHIVPHADGTVAIGSTSESAYSHNIPDDELTSLLERAFRICPQLAAAPVIDRWSGIRPRARSRAPLLGGWPGRSGHFVANGGFKIGFGMAPKIAAVMADLILDDVDDIPEGFRLT